MKNKTLQDFKDDYVRTDLKQGYTSWVDFTLQCYRHDVTMALDIIANRYAAHVAEHMCRKQRQLATEILNSLAQLHTILDKKKTTISQQDELEAAKQLIIKHTSIVSN